MLGLCNQIMQSDLLLAIFRVNKSFCENRWSTVRLMCNTNKSLGPKQGVVVVMHKIASFEITCTLFSFQLWARWILQLASI